MILDAQGRPIRKVAAPNTTERKGMQFDAYSLPDGAIVDLDKSKEFQNRLRNDVALRERIEVADRMVGTKTLHLAVLQRGEMSSNVEKALISNQKFAQKIMEKRTKEENLKRSKVA